MPNENGSQSIKFDIDFKTTEDGKKTLFIPRECPRCHRGTIEPCIIDGKEVLGCDECKYVENVFVPDKI